MVHVTCMYSDFFKKCCSRSKESETKEFHIWQANIYVCSWHSTISRHCYWRAANIWHMLSTLDQSAVRSQLLWRASSVYTVIFEDSDIYSCCRALSKLSLPVWTTKFVVNSARTPIFPMQGKRNTNWATTDIK